LLLSNLKTKTINYKLSTQNSQHVDNALKIENILGYAANDNPLRASKGGESFEGLIPSPTWTEEVVQRNGSVTDTVSRMAEVIRHFHWQAAKVAPLMQGTSLYDTCRNIWNFLFYHIRYNEDTPNKEELRTFARSFAQRRTGIDCDDFSIAAGSILYCLNIPFHIRIARYKGVDHFQHVYLVVPEKNKRPIVIDAVLDEYDKEKPTIEHKDYLIMSNTNLNGINISVLGDVQDTALNEVGAILTGADFSKAAELEELGSPDTETEELTAIKNHLQRTRELVANRPEFVSHVEHPQTFLGMVDYALKYWDTDKRDEALGILEGEENRFNELSGLGSASEGTENIELYYGLNNLGTFDVLGKAKAPKKFFTSVNTAVKSVAQKAITKPAQQIENKIKQVQNANKATQKITKVATKTTKAIVKYNPAVASIRAAVLLALKTNVGKMASKMKFGYLTEAEAKAQNLDMAEWNKARTQLVKIEKLFVDTLQGNATNFKNAILTGRAGRLSGDDLGLDGLGEPVTAASTAAAAPFLLKIADLLKVVDFNKLVAKVSPDKLSKERKTAETDKPVPDGNTAIPENNNPPANNNSNTEAPAAKRPAPTEAPATTETPATQETPAAPNDKGEGGAKTQSPGESAPNAATASNPDKASSENLPATKAPENAAASTAAKIGFFDKAVNYVKENPGTSLLFAGGAALAIYGLFAPSGSKQGGLSGTGTPRKKKKRKKQPEQLPNISGTQSPKKKPKRRDKKHNTKKYKL